MIRPIMKESTMLIRTIALVALSATLGLAQPAIANDEFSQIAEAADRFANSGKPVYISAERLSALLNDADAGNDPVLISVCAPDDYAKAHIRGSINIPRGAFWKPANFAKLPPKDKPIVTYCYTGTGAVGPATVLALMGYDAVQLEWGTMGWSRNDVALGPATRFPESQQDYPIDTAATNLAATWSRPVIATGKSTLADILIARGDAVEAADRSVSMTAEQVQGALTDSNPSNDPFVVDVRAPADYAKGHIKGAVNIPANTIYQAGSLAKLPLGRRIVIVDSNGQTAVGMSYMLSILGYNARGLQFGMMGWSKDDKLIAPFRRFPTDQKDYPVIVAR
jgi:rhodanese-related sulfurtransferase